MATKTAVGIDASWTCTGLVALKCHPPERSHFVWEPDIQTVKSKPEDFTNEYHRLADVVEQIMHFVRNVCPSVIVIEGYSFGSKNAREKMGELGGYLRLQLWEECFPFYICPPTSLKKFVTGKGNVNKTAVALACFKRWEFESDDDNVTDAYGLAKIGETILADKHTKEFQKLFMKKLELIGK